jgi:hypothetical protein
MNVGKANNAWIQKQEGSRQTQGNDPMGPASSQPGSQSMYEVAPLAVYEAGGIKALGTVARVAEGRKSKLQCLIYTGAHISISKDSSLQPRI